MRKAMINNSDTCVLLDFEAFKVGHYQIDDEHANLLRVLNRLVQSPLSDVGLGSFDDIFGELGKTIIDHFNYEESVFKRLGMPDQEMQAHLQAHIDIIEDYSMLCIDQLDNVAPTRESRLSMVKQWIFGHIADHDLKLRPYFAKAAANPCWAG